MHAAAELVREREDVAPAPGVVEHHVGMRAGHGVRAERAAALARSHGRIDPALVEEALGPFRPSQARTREARSARCRSPQATRPRCPRWRSPTIRLVLEAQRRQRGSSSSRPEPPTPSPTRRAARSCTTSRELTGLERLPPTFSECSTSNDRSRAKNRWPMAFPNRRGRAGAPRGRFALGEGVATPRARVEGGAHGSDCARGRSRIHMQTMHTRTLTLGRGAKWLIAALSALLACLTVAASASAATSTGTVTVSGTAPSSSGTTLTNTFLTSYAAATVTGGICDPQGTSTVSFEIDGTASAPYAGTFHETGTVTIGPQTGINGRGEITDFRSSFSINSSTGTVHGTKTGGLSQYNYAICTPGTAGSVVSSQIIASALTYEASITKPDGGTFNDSGTTWDNFNAYSGAQRTNTQYEFRSNFSSQVPVTPDTQAPKLTLPATITKQATSAAGVAVDYTVAATDNVDSNPKVACSPVAGSTFPVGTTTVNCTATDAAGNKSTGSFDIVVTAQPDTE